MCADHVTGHPGVLPAVGLRGEDDAVYLGAAGAHCVPAADIKDSAAHLSRSATHRLVTVMCVFSRLCVEFDQI